MGEAAVVRFPLRVVSHRGAAGTQGSLGLHAFSAGSEKPAGDSGRPVVCVKDRRLWGQREAPCRLQGLRTVAPDHLLFGNRYQDFTKSFHLGISLLGIFLRRYSDKRINILYKKKVYNT